MVMVNVIAYCIGLCAKRKDHKCGCRCDHGLEMRGIEEKSQVQNQSEMWDLKPCVFHENVFVIDGF